jgi:hypothetical protein
MASSEIEPGNTNLFVPQYSISAIFKSATLDTKPSPNPTHSETRKKQQNGPQILHPYRWKARYTSTYKPTSCCLACLWLIAETTHMPSIAEQAICERENTVCQPHTWHEMSISCDSTWSATQELTPFESHFPWSQLLSSYMSWTATVTQSC